MIRIPVAAQIIAILERSGAKGVARVRCKLIEEKYRDKIIIRNVMGPIKVGDVILIQEHDVAMESISAIE